MHAFSIDNGYVVRLDPGEEIITTLGRFLGDHAVKGGTISGIGAVHNTTLGYFDLAEKTYHRREFPEEMELLNLQGNITWVDGERLVHAHVLLSGPDYAAVGGHLFSAEIAVTGEFTVLTSERIIHRAPDARSGLNLIADDGEG